MKASILIPAAFAEDVTADFVARGGQLSERASVETGIRLTGLVTEQAIVGYGASLRDMTAGHGTYRAEFDHFAADSGA